MVSYREHTWILRKGWLIMTRPIKFKHSINALYSLIVISAHEVPVCVRNLNRDIRSSSRPLVRLMYISIFL